MSLRGNLQKTSLYDLLADPEIVHGTGTLVFINGDSNGYLCFRDGYIVYASDSEKQHDFTHRLAACGLVERDRLGEAEYLNETSRREDSMGRILVDLGYVHESSLHSFILDQMQEIVLRLLRWDEGEYTFHQDELLPEADIGCRIKPEKLLAEAERQLAEWEQIERSVQSLDARFRKVKDPSRGPEECGLMLDEKLVLNRLTGDGSVRDLIRESGLPAFQVSKAVFGLINVGLVEPVADGPVGHAPAHPGGRAGAAAGQPESTKEYYRQAALEQFGDSEIYQETEERRRKLESLEADKEFTAPKGNALQDQGYVAEEAVSGEEEAPLEWAGALSRMIGRGATKGHQVHVPDETAGEMPPHGAPTDEDTDDEISDLKAQYIHDAIDASEIDRVIIESSKQEGHDEEPTIVPPVPEEELRLDDPGWGTSDTGGGWVARPSRETDDPGILLPPSEGAEDRPAVEINGFDDELAESVATTSIFSPRAPVAEPPEEGPLSDPLATFSEEPVEPAPSTTLETPSVTVEPPVLEETPVEETPPVLEEPVATEWGGTVVDEMDAMGVGSEPPAWGPSVEPPVEEVPDAEPIVEEVSDAVPPVEEVSDAEPIVEEAIDYEQEPPAVDFELDTPAPVIATPDETPVAAVDLGVEVLEADAVSEEEPAGMHASADIPEEPPVPVELVGLEAPEEDRQEGPVIGRAELLEIQEEPPPVEPVEPPTPQPGADDGPLDAFPYAEVQALRDLSGVAESPPEEKGTQEPVVEQTVEEPSSCEDAPGAEPGAQGEGICLPPVDQKIFDDEDEGLLGAVSFTGKREAGTALVDLDSFELEEELLSLAGEIREKKRIPMNERMSTPKKAPEKKAWGIRSRGK